MPCDTCKKSVLICDCAHTWQLERSQVVHSVRTLAEHLPSEWAHIPHQVLLRAIAETIERGEHMEPSGVYHPAGLPWGKVTQ